MWKLRTRKRTSAPLLGIVTDGRYWLCIQLHQRYLAITPLLDASHEVTWLKSVRVLSQNLDAACLTVSQRDLECKEQFWTLHDPEPEPSRGMVCTLGSIETAGAASL